MYMYVHADGTIGMCGFFSLLYGTHIWAVGEMEAICTKNNHPI